MRLKRRDKQQQVPTRNGHEHGADRHLQPSLDITPLSSVSHTDAGTTSPDATDFYTCTARACTAVIAAVTAALSTDIHTAACTSSAADPRTRSTAKHEATATRSTAKHAATTAHSTAKHPATATHAAAAGNSTTAFHTVTAASTAAAATTDNTNTSANTAASAAAHIATQSVNITAANVTEHRFIITAACHVTTRYNARH